MLSASAQSGKSAPAPMLKSLPCAFDSGADTSDLLRQAFRIDSIPSVLVPSTTTIPSLTPAASAISPWHCALARVAKTSAAP